MVDSSSYASNAAPNLSGGTGPISGKEACLRNMSSANRPLNNWQTSMVKPSKPFKNTLTIIRMHNQAVWPLNQS